MPRRHIKKDDRNTLCGLSMSAKFQKNLAADRQSVTCGACELASRPKTAPPPPPPVMVEAFAGPEGEGMDEGAPREGHQGF